LGSLVDGRGVLEREIAIQSALGRDKLFRAYHTILKNWIGDKPFLHPNNCYSRTTCAAGRAKIAQRLELFENEENSQAQQEDDSQHEDDSHPFLDPWEKFDFEFCTLCLPSMKLAYKSACEELWSQLPGFFGLQPWDELKDFDM
jgi:hypothetical protein